MKRLLTVLLALVLCVSAVLPVLPEQAAPLAPVAEAATYETAWWPAPTMRITQIAYESYSHGSQNALDYAPGGRVFAPFTGKITYKDANWGYVVFQSSNKVYFANGTLDYMTVTFMHDGNISDLYVGQVISQGTNFYDQGGMGSGNANAYAYHVHMGVYKGHVAANSGYGNGNIYAYQALAINSAKTTSIVNQGVMASGNYTTNGAPTNYTGLWKTTSQVQSGPPTTATVTTANKDSFAVNENVTFNMTSNGDSNTLWIYKPDGTSTYYQNAGTSKTLSFATAGKYQALVEAWNGEGSKCSSKITFYVGNPTTATVKTNKSSYTTGESVTFTMSSDGATNTLWIYKPDGTSQYYEKAGTSKSLTFSTPGTYQALVEAWNGVGSKCSTKITFTVTQGSATTTTTPTTATSGKPTSASIKTDKSSYTVGENVVFTYSGNGDTNTIWIYYPDGTSKYYEKAGTTKTLTFSTPGTYQALVETWNGVGSFCSSKITFTVNAAASKPNSATIKSNKTTYAVNEDVVLTVTGNGTTNDIYMARIDGQWNETRTNVGTSLTMNFGWAGTYEAYVVTKNTAGSYQSAKIQFVIGTPTETAAPTKSNISVNKTSVKVGESITFTFDTNGTSNTLWIYAPSGAQDAHYENVGTSKTMSFTVAGKYEALVEAWNGVGSKQSAKISFTVTNPTSAPTTAKPTTAKPTTAKPTTAKPTTAAPTTAKPTTAKPTTAAPTTVKPTTAKPTTVAPTTAKPTTVAPTTAKPTTVAPTTVAPTTAAPTTAKPTTAAPTTVAPTTVKPTTKKPTTKKPATVKPTVLPPSMAQVITDKQNYLPGETVNFICSGNGSEYTLLVVFPDGTNQTIEQITDTYALSVTEPGVYTAVLRASNAGGSISSAAIVFTVTAPTDVPTEAPTTAPTQTPTQAPTQAPTTAATQPSTSAPAANSGLGNFLWLIILVVALAILLILLLIILLLKKKKQKD